MNIIGSLSTYTHRHTVNNCNSEIKICEECNTLKATKIIINGTEVIVPCLCACKTALRDEAALNEKIKQQKYMLEQKLRSAGLLDKQYSKYCFENDDGANLQMTKLARKYADNFQQMFKENYGLLFFGDVGTGKSFYACCIANELARKGVSVLVTSMARIINKLQSMGFGDDKNAFINSFSNYGLVVIDDLGAERSTSYSTEQVYNIIDVRYRSKKPLIVTTNLTSEQIKNADNMAEKRIYDRVMESCIPQMVNGDKRRMKIMQAQKDKFNKFMEKD